MEVSVKNFGTLEEANVHIGGLTVITGENDTGKSTIGKILFSLVKAIARYEEDLEEDKEARVTSIAEHLYFSLRRLINIASHTELRDLFHPRKLYSQLRLDRKKAIQDRILIIDNLRSTGLLPQSLYEQCINNIEKIQIIMDEPDDQISAINRAIRKSFFSEFKGEIIQKSLTTPGNASININDGASELIDISWTKDGIHTFNYSDDLGYVDATYVDSPAIMQFHHLVKMARTLFDNADASRLTVPLHVKDLAAKLSDSIYDFSAHPDLLTTETNDDTISSKINSIFGGQISYDADKIDFVLERNGYKLSSSNIASGIKSLGILDLLIKSGSVKSNSLLILDEPEVNLHPKWQVDYCEIICELVSAGVDIIVSTHSPYIIEALKHFSEKNDIANTFYLAAKNPDTNLSKFEDITGRIDVAIDKLAAPLVRLNKDLFDDF